MIISLADLESTISMLHPSGNIIIAGDLNAHLTDPEASSRPNSREGLAHECLHRHQLFPFSSSCYASGPKYTFFSNSVHTMVDYVLTDSSVTCLIDSCYVHEHHPLNLSDHLPISVILQAVTTKAPHTEIKPCQINWALAVQRNDIHAYAFLETCPDNVNDLHWEITHVCQLILKQASVFLPHKDNKKRKPYIIDDHLKFLCKRNKEAWIKWRDAGRPSQGHHVQQKKVSKNNVRQFVASARAKQERLKIQKRDEMFKEHHPQRFKAPKSCSSECSKLMVNSKPITDTHSILQEFKSFYSLFAP